MTAIAALILGLAVVAAAVGENQSVARDCRCCCACDVCYGVGFWGQLTVTISGSVTGKNGTWTLSPSGNCIYEFSGGPFFLVLEFNDVAFGGGANCEASYNVIAGGQVKFRGLVGCLGPFTLTHYSSSPSDPDATMSVTGVPGTWVSCGQDDEGTPIGEGLDEEDELLAAAAAPSRRTVRCLHLGRRLERTGCCDGERLHACDRGHAARPGGFCQGCPDYAADGDATW